MERSNAEGFKPSVMLSVVGGIVLADAFTKLVAVDRLVPVHTPHPVFGEWLRWTLVYNPGAAFGFHLGPYSRWIFIALTFVALGGSLTLVACGGSSEISPVAPQPPAASQSDDGGVVASDGYGPGTGTCSNDCDGTGQGSGLGTGTGNSYGPGPGPSDGFCGNACVGPVGPDPADIVAILGLALQEEYGAEALEPLRAVVAEVVPDCQFLRARAAHGEQGGEAGAGDDLAECHVCPPGS